MTGLAEIVRERGLPATIAGLPPIFTLDLKSGDADLDRKLQSAFYGGLLRRGVLCVRQWLTSYSHSRDDVEQTLEAAAAAGREAAAALG